LLTILAAVMQPYASQLFAPRPAPAGNAQGETTHDAKPESPSGEVDPGEPAQLLQQAEKLCAEIESLSPPATADQIATFYDRLENLSFAVRAAKPNSKRETSSLGHALHVLAEARQALNQLGANSTQGAPQ